MSASNKFWLMLGGLAVLVVGVALATNKINGRWIPTAEITPTVVSTNASPAAPSRTHLPTILHAKPVTGAEPSTSPRYVSRDANQEFLPFERSQPVLDPTSTLPSSPDQRVAPRFDTGSPAFRQPDAVDPQSSMPQPSEATFVQPSNVDAPKTYLTVADDSFWKISKLRYDGEGKFFKALYYHNRNRVERPDKIPAGVEIDTPPLAELKRLYPDLCQPGNRLGAAN